MFNFLIAMTSVNVKSHSTCATNLKISTVLHYEVLTVFKQRSTKTSTVCQNHKYHFPMVFSRNLQSFSELCSRKKLRKFVLLPCIWHPLQFHQIDWLIGFIRHFQHKKAISCLQINQNFRTIPELKNQTRLLSGEKVWQHSRLFYTS